MKAREVLEKYRITRNTLHQWVKRGKIAFTLTPTGRTFQCVSIVVVSAKR